MQLRNCTFCGTQIEPGTGMMFIRRDGAYLFFCSRKCRVNMQKLRRIPRNTRWTNDFRNVKNLKHRAAKNQ